MSDDEGMAKIDNAAFDVMFREARTFPGWTDEKVDPKLLEEIYEVMKWGPTSMNASSLRVVFVTTPEAKEKLKPCLMQGNVNQTMTAPVTAIFAYDEAFWQRMPELWPHSDVRGFFEGKDNTVFNLRNATLQAAYFMVVARGMGLDCGPMSGFDHKAVDEAFFAGTTWKSNFLCNLGYGDKAKLRPRGPRLKFEEVAKII